MPRLNVMVTTNQDGTELRRLQLVQLEMLKVVDQFCEDHNIKYSLYAGTLLGAVRHKGFIPWDDDIDLCMERGEYDRFIKAWIQDGPEGYLIQNKDIEPAYVQSFAKIRKDHSTFLQDESERGRWHTGIFIDIFPIDRVPKNRLKQKLFYLNALLYQLYTREFVPPLSGGVTAFITKTLLELTAKNKIRTKLRKIHYRKLTSYNEKRSFPMIGTEIQSTLKQILPHDMMDDYIKLDFEDGQFSCMKGYEEYLTIKFGDYNKLPPEEERTWRHHPIILDFEHNLNEI